ncbi:TPA: hypothetical protein H2R31_005164, partial [Salmonella enterica]|nr:hypothetical protein [Salmonella enterica]
GNAAGTSSNGVSLSNVALTATQGKIAVTGMADDKHTEYFRNAGGILLQNKVTFKSIENVVNAYAFNPTNGFAAISFYQGVDVHFIGDTTINTYANGGSYLSTGLLFANPGSYNQKVSFEDGLANVNAVGGILLGGTSGKVFTPEFHVSNATLNITASSDKGVAIATLQQGGSAADNAQNSGYIFTGNGNISIKGVTTSDGDTALQLRQFNNTGLNGTFTVHGESMSGAGIIVDRNANFTVHNATITGSSQTGTGIQINAGDKYSHQVNLNGNTLTGISGTGTGININGNNVTITNGSLNGTS